MLFRIVSFLVFQALGASLGWWLAELPVALVAAIIGAWCWFVTDLWRGNKVVAWLRHGDVDTAPQLLGLWGEATDRARRLVRQLQRNETQAEDRLHQVLTAIQASPNGVVLLDEHSHIEWCNQTACDHFGFNLERDHMQVVTNLVRAPEFISYFNAGVLWAVQKGNPKGISLDNLCGKKVGVQTGTVEEDPDVSGRSAACVAAGKPAIEIVSLKNQTDVTTRLVGGTIDAMSADSPITRNALAKTNGQLEPLGAVYDSAEQGIAIAKDDLAFATVVEKVMNKLIQDGTYMKILTKWNNAEGALTQAVLNPAAKS